MKVLVTGAAGFIGKHLARKLVSTCDVYGLIRGEAAPDAPAEVSWIRQDLALALDYSRLPEKIDAVVHLAQSRLYKQFPSQAADIFDVNVRSTFLLLEYARQAGADHFIFASTGGVYGYGPDKFTEESPTAFPGFYASSKYAAELLIANYRQFFCAVTLRLFFPYGPGQKGMLISTLFDKVKRGEPITVEGDPGIRINPIYIADVLKAIESAMSLPESGLFNVAGDEAVTITDLIRVMEQVAGTESIVRHTGAASAGDLVGDNTMMKQVLGVQPLVPLLEGLKSIY